MFLMRKTRLKAVKLRLNCNLYCKSQEKLLALFFLRYFFNLIASVTPYLYPAWNVYITEYENNAAIPTPNKNPVMNLLKFVLSYDVNRCVKPSIIIGIIITTAAINDGRQNQNSKMLEIIPTSSPVHLAHIGN